jgi:hypothetical protein
MTSITSYATLSARRVPVYSCGSMRTSYTSLRDAVAWESFDEPALVKYLTSGAQALRHRIHKVPDLSQKFDENTAKELYFMLESLLYVRALLAEDPDSFLDEENEQ